MKKFFVLILAAGISTGAFAQSQGSKASGINDIGFSETSGIQLIGDWHIGTDFVLGNADIKAKSNRLNSVQFGFNMLKIYWRPYESGSFSLGADVEWNWYYPNKQNVWIPTGSAGSTTPTEGGKFLNIISNADAGVKEVKSSIFSICTFEFPVNFMQRLGDKVTFTLGASPELNLPGVVQFKGTNTAGENVNCMRSGARYSKAIETRLFTFNVHAALSYRKIGFYVKYRPMNVIAQDYGPQFTTLTVGLALGLGI